MDKRITLFSVMLCLLWGLGIIVEIPQQISFMYMVQQLVMLSGLLTLGYMSLAMALSIRSYWIEKKVKGLDKMYHLHKQLGIASVSMLLVHWGLASINEYRGDEVGLFERSMQHSGYEFGELALYLLLFFSAVSLLKLVKYHNFKLIHKLGGVVFGLGAIHSVLLLNAGASQMPYNAAVIGLTIVGVFCAVISLTGRIGKNKKVSGEVINVRRETDTVIFDLKLNQAVEVNPGQFAFLGFDDKESQHPFTIANYNPETRIAEFAIKALGDYTSKLITTLNTGDLAEFEGPYGCFSVPNDKEQVWVGAGIGITPFIAWVESLPQSGKQSSRIHLYYCVNREVEAYYHDRLQQIIDKLENIELTLVVKDEGDTLTAEQIVANLASEDYALSFCGPEPFINSLEKQLDGLGSKPSSVHRERFDMR